MPAPDERRPAPYPVAMLLPLALATGCVSADAPLAGYAGVRSQIETYYDGRAMEANATCPNPRMEAINDASVIEDSPSTVVMLVRYRWVDDNITSDVGDGSRLDCWDWSERRFTFDRNGDALTLRSMSGLQRGGTAGS